MARLIALLRAVNVGGRKLPMAELRLLCGALGWTDVETYIQSGNVVFTAPGKNDGIERQLEDAIKGRFGMDVPVMVRTASQWAGYVGANPFPNAARDEPHRLQLLVSKNALNGDAAEKLMGRAQGGESVRAAGGALWFHFPEGVGTSKLVPTVIDRVAGSPSTSRNWRTVLKLQEMAC
ncbi:MAG TPA: DUF1697 domain-containing protein [Allosphingosinicella sp.]|jgi:uncharacterized protein (DUF1697 family)